ncbi:transcription factor FER-LIKE IRON DEFICIENCY-INDUCED TRANSCRIPTION FACTOR-like [Diospyros lotus]|uniref:transcription factor FER-LIKE IRON DEFICIENCY-INDUCED TRANSCRIPTION FACTOR-like n=1 Tax=Diospyros lotus TaxID=55363 RepID=UPI002256087D|nr:transcription factor FER-LIKE IRON DEFICIENCY-INDUCED TRANSCRIPTION FACTOR-like [Diospyros lotus]
MDSFGNQVVFSSHSQYFMDETNFDQHFAELIRGEATDDPTGKFCLNYECEHIAGCLGANNRFEPTFLADHYLFDDFSPLPAMPNANPELNTILAADAKNGEEENDIGESSSATTTTSSKSTKKRTDRSRTLISERRRRGRMKEKLYLLRALVPNITKMDKASIVGDAVLHVQELQMQANKLRAEIAELESSLAGGGRHQQSIVQNRHHIQLSNSNYPVCKQITQMDICQVEERGFYVRIECVRGLGAAISLYKALESLGRYSVQSSNLATKAGRFILTFTSKVRESEPDLNLPNLKLWVAGALLNQGFKFQTQPST